MTVCEQLLPEIEKAQSVTPKPLNIDIGQSFPVDPLKVLKKIVPQQHYFCQYLRKQCGE